MRMMLMICAALLATPATAQQFAEGSEAAEWGLLGEEKARFEADVVDLLCRVAGDCPADCGAGRRQLGLLRVADGVLVLPLKNGQPLFSGAATDLAPYCGQRVTVDGLLIGDPDQTPVKYYMVQAVRPAGSDGWAKTERFTEVWAERNPDRADKSGEWYRHDPRVEGQIAAQGYLGRGTAEEAEYLKGLVGE